MRDYYDIDLALDIYIEMKLEGKEIKDNYLKAIKKCIEFFGEDFMANELWDSVDDVWARIFLDAKAHIECNGFY